MKTRYFVAAVAGALLTLSSCVGDLETTPLNESDKTSETAYNDTAESYLPGLAKLYNTMSSEKVSYVTVKDKGASQITRAFFACQEITTDACKVGWGDDAWCRAMNTNTWTDAENDAVFGVFFRSIQSISYCNEFLRQTTAEKLDDRGVSPAAKAVIDQYRAEARVIRAWYYWMAMDVFGAVPFATENDAVGATAPAQAPKEKIYAYVVSELEALVADNSALPAAQSNYPRMDKGAALGLLARIYLNAETYSGKPEWDKCKTTCEKIFALGYTLAPTYAELFRGDNGENLEARNEFLMAVPFDTNSQQSNGGTTFLVRGASAQSDVDANGFLLGVNGAWGGIRIDNAFVEKFYSPANADVTTGEYSIADKRGQIFYIKDRKSLTIADEDQLYTFLYGWSCFKFNNIPHDKTQEEYKETAAEETFTNIDLPIIRLGEIYLIYAEACCRLGQGATAQAKMDELAVRTGVAAMTVPQSWDDAARDAFCAERARELLWESCRRTDLIRYDLYSTNTYLWPFKGNASAIGQKFDKYKELFAIPASQIKANPDLKNPVGY